MLVHEEDMAVNKNVREKLVFEIQRWAVEGTQMFVVSIRITTVHAQQRFVAERHSSLK